MNWLLSIVEEISPHAGALTFVGVVIIVVMSLYKRQKIHANDIANFATTAGIAFTFLGIILALGGLGNLGEQADIRQKIDALLGGIFVAFIPSIFGAAIAVSTHLLPEFWRKPIEENEQETDIDAQILQELRRLNTNLVGDGETSLTTRLEKFQLKVTENQDALRREFQEFAQNVSDNIIEALKQSMADLNEKLGQQFGENFGRFADVIPRLLEWQENYRETIENTQQQLEEQIGHLKSLLESLDRANVSFTDITKHVDRIAECANHIDQATDKISTSLTQAAIGIENMSVNAEQFQKAAQSLTENITKQTELAVSQRNTFQHSANDLEHIAKNVVILDNTAQQLNQHIETMSLTLGGVSRLSDAIQGKAESIEQNMKDITGKAVSELAGNLRGISEALVNDYRSVQMTINEIKQIGSRLGERR